MRVLYVDYALWKQVAQANGFSVYDKAVAIDTRKSWVGALDLIYATDVSSADFSDYSAAFPSRTSVDGEDEAIARIAGLKGTVGRQADGVPLQAKAPRVGSEIVLGSHNFCDRTTWFGDSVRVTDQALEEKSGSSGLIWKSTDSDHVNWIDMVTGRVHNQEHWSKEVEHGYSVIVKVDSAEKTACPPFKFESSDGDYWIDYDNGEVHSSEDWTGKTVVASFSYATESAFYITPHDGTTLRIEDAEADFSADMVLETSFGYIIEGYVDVFAPELTPVPFPSGTRIPLQEDKYYRVTQIITEARGALPQVEAIGATDEHKALTDIKEFRRKSRGMKNAVQAVPFNYVTARDLYANYGMRLKIVTQDHVPVGGEMLTMTFYCTSLEE